MNNTKINTDKKYCVFIIQIKTWVENNNNKYKTKTKIYYFHLDGFGWSVPCFLTFDKSQR